VTAITEFAPEPITLASDTAVDTSAFRAAQAVANVMDSPTFRAAQAAANLVNSHWTPWFGPS
jgi:hypothetical protein